MHPNTAAPPSQDDGFDAWAALDAVTAEPRSHLVADIVGHPRSAPSVAELDYVNPSIQADTIRHHLGILEEAEVVEAVTLEPGKRSRDLPRKFYRVTEEAQELFDKVNIFPEEAWRRQYERVDKTPRIRKIESMPRP